MQTSNLTKVCSNPNHTNGMPKTISIQAKNYQRAQFHRSGAPFQDRTVQRGEQLYKKTASFVEHLPVRRKAKHRKQMEAAPSKNLFDLVIAAIGKYVTIHNR